MDAASLRELQAPLKTRYREQPEEALVTLRAEGSLDADGIACRVETGRALVEAGLHPATGGSGLQACSGDMLLEALVACAGVTLRAVATALEFRLKGGSVSAEGDLDCELQHETGDEGGYERHACPLSRRDRLAEQANREKREECRIDSAEPAVSHHRR